jgi:hypothetical protein
LQNSPNSTLEFGEFSKLRKKNLLNLSLENSPNSALEFGEFSKLILVCEKKHVFGILFLLNLSSGKSPNSTLEFGEFSKLNL